MLRQSKLKAKSKSKRSSSSTFKFLRTSSLGFFAVAYLAPIPAHALPARFPAANLGPSLISSTTTAPGQNCTPSATPGIFSQIEQLTAGFGCPTPAERAEISAQAENNHLFPENTPRPMQTSVFGLSLRGSAEEIQMVRDLLGTQPPSRLHARPNSCDTARCTLIQAYGNEEAALRAMNLYKRFGYSLSVSQDENLPGHEALWNAEQLQKVQATLEKLPTSFHKMGALKAIKLLDIDSLAASKQHHKVTENFGGLMVYSEKTLLITTQKPGEDIHPWAQIDRILTHELGHAFDYNYGKGGNFRDLSHFTELSQANTGFTSHYAAKDTEEDFAESISYFVHAPQILKDRSPEKFAFIKQQVFGGTGGGEAGKKSWPEFEQELSLHGGCKAMIQKCLGQIHAPFKNSENVLFYDNNSLSAFEVDAFIDSTRCYSGSAQGLETALKNTPGFCEFNGRDGIEKQIRAACANDLWTTLSQVQSIAANPEKSVISSCINQKPFSTRCYLDRMQASLEARGIPSPAAARSPEVLLAALPLAAPEALNGEYPATTLLAASLQAPSEKDSNSALNPRKIAIEALTEVDQISYDSLQKSYLFWQENSVRFSPLPPKSLRAKNQASDREFSDRLMQSRDTQKILENFSTQVFSGFKNQARACKKSLSCREQVKRRLLADWTQQLNLTITPQQAAKLRSLLK